MVASSINPYPAACMCKAYLVPKLVWLSVAKIGGDVGELPQPATQQTPRATCSFPVALALDVYHYRTNTVPPCCIGQPHVRAAYTSLGYQAEIRLSKAMDKAQRSLTKKHILQVRWQHASQIGWVIDFMHRDRVWMGLRMGEMMYEIGE
eukprot:1162117-Pelagomonas_calceolata.AAC.5